MSLKQHFCSSPWIHMRITHSGNFDFCRWRWRNSSVPSPANISDTDPLEYFQNSMANVRSELLQGNKLEVCHDCHNMEKYQKISGRQRQLLKTGIVLDHFDASARSSTFFDEFAYSEQTQGTTQLYPVDWQIDLGNYCNGACLFCDPDSSSKIAVEYFKLKLISEMPPRNWTDDPAAVDRFVNCLEKTPELTYLHFLGGETLITPAFKTILTRLVKSGLAQKVSIGFTTNLMTWDEEINDLLTRFKEVNVGVSVECLHPVNDYARWPSKIESVKKTLDQWVELGQQHNWLTTIRITPTLLTVSHLLSIYQYAWEKKISVESCNFLAEPKVLRMSVLPQDIRNSIAKEILNWINQKSQNNHNVFMVVNSRDPNKSHQSILQDAASYANFLLNAADETHRLPELVDFLKIREASRNNSILDYLPEYEQLLRTAGY